MEKEEAKSLLKRHITVVGGPVAVDKLADEQDEEAKDFVTRFSTVAGSREAIEALAGSDEPELCEYCGEELNDGECDNYACDSNHIMFTFDGTGYELTELKSADAWPAFQGVTSLNDEQKYYIREVGASKKYNFEGKTLADINGKDFVSYDE